MKLRFLFPPVTVGLGLLAGSLTVPPVLAQTVSPRLDPPYGDPDDPVAWTCPSRQGGFIRLNATGLGPTILTVTEHGVMPLTVAQPAVTIGGKAATVIRSYLGVPYLGAYQIELTPAPDTPEGLQPVVLTIEGQTSNSVNVIVGMLASSRSIHAAPDSIAWASGCANPLAVGEFAGDPTSPPTQLGGTTVKVTDAAGVDRMAAIVSVSATQAQLIVPPQTGNGLATVTITSGAGGISTAPLQIATVEPYLNSVTCYPWCSPPQGYLVRVRNGVETLEPFIDENNFFIPIDLGPPTDRVYLVMFGTGFRHYSSLAGVRVDVGGVDAAIQSIGPDSEIAGLDRVKVLLPRELVGATDGTYVSLRVDGKTTVSLDLFFQ